MGLHMGEKQRADLLYWMKVTELTKCFCKKKGVKIHVVTNLGTYAGPLFFSPHDSFHLSFLLYLFGLPHLSTFVSQIYAY